MTQPQHSRYGRRYSSRVMLRARELKLAGWSTGKIADILQREIGVRPSPGTIRAWCKASGRSGAERARDRTAHRRAYRAKNPVVRPRVSEDWKLEQMRAMRERGVGFRAIGQVAAVMWGEELTKGEVEGRLKGQRAGEQAA